MSRPNRQKISTEGGAAVGGGMFQGFAGLEITGLPPAPETSPETPPETAGNPVPPGPPRRGRVVLRRETAHRGGKCVIVVEGFDSALDGDFLAALFKRLRARCGCGGALKGRSLEFQGEQAARLRELLVAEGFKVAGVK